MSRRMRQKVRRAAVEPESFDMREVVRQIDQIYGEAIRVLAAALRARGGAEKHISGYWHHEQNIVDLPDWERDFDRKYADNFDILLGAAKEYGLNPQAYLEDYFAACEALGGQPPANLDRFLPWKMSPSDLARFKRPVASIFG